MTTLLDKIKARDSKLFILAADCKASTEIMGGVNIFRAYDKSGLVIDTCIADTPEEALRVVQVKRPDFIFTEPHYNKEFHEQRNGIGFIKTLRKKHNYDGIIIAHCADSDEHYDVLAAGADDFIHDESYISPKNLSTDIRRALEYFLERKLE